jgi:ABC-type amino acid transport system permease subunit
MRGVPLVTFTLLFYFGLPVVGISLNPVPAAVFSVVLNTTAFNAEIWRAAIVDFPRDQLDAARAFGMTEGLVFRRIVVPQAWRASLPALLNEMTYLVKGTPAVAVIGVVELTRAAHQVAARTFDPIPPFLVATVIYIAALFLLVRAGRGLEAAVQRRYGVL